MTMVNGIMSTQKPDYTRFVRSCGCDLPEDGGITGNIGKKSFPGAFEERPQKYDWKTGEMVYVDEWLKQKAIEDGAMFSTTA